MIFVLTAYLKSCLSCVFTWLSIPVKKKAGKITKVLVLFYFTIKSMSHDCIVLKTIQNILWH